MPGLEPDRSELAAPPAVTHMQYINRIQFISLYLGWLLDFTPHKQSFIFAVVKKNILSQYLEKMTPSSLTSLSCSRRRTVLFLLIRRLRTNTKMISDTMTAIRSTPTTPTANVEFGTALCGHQEQNTQSALMV